jgi:hypothetical protein
MKIYGRVEVYSSTILDLDTTWRLVVTLMSRPLYLRGGCGYLFGLQEITS